MGWNCFTGSNAEFLMRGWSIVSSLCVGQCRGQVEQCLPFFLNDDAILSQPVMICRPVVMSVILKGVSSVVLIVPGLIVD